VARTPRAAILDTEPKASPADAAVAESTAPQATANGSAVATGAGDGMGTLAYVDPRTLVIRTNVRSKAEIADLVPDVRARGVRTPIEVYLGEDGQYEVYTGQRRTLAAIEAARATVPILIVDRPAEIDRIVEQVQENVLRHELSTADQVAAYEQLSMFGLSAAQIAKKFSSDKKTIEAGLAVAKSTKTRAVLNAAPALDVQQGAIIAELAEDDDALRERLMKAALDGDLDHKAQQVRDERTRATFKANLLQQLKKQNIAVVGHPMYRDNAVAAVADLQDRHGVKLDPAAHTKCPGHSVYLIETGDLKDPWKTEAACREFGKYGHYRSGGKLRVRDMEPEQAARERAERADVINSNKAWESAEKVRRAWLTEYATRKTLPKPAARFLLESFTHGGSQLTLALRDGHPMGTKLLGINASPIMASKRRTTLTDMLDKASDARAQVICLALVLGAHEDATGKHSWRNVDSDTKRYLRFLADQGYKLSPVERRAAALPPADTTEAAAPVGDDGDEASAPAAQPDSAPSANGSSESAQ